MPPCRSITMTTSWRLESPEAATSRMSSACCKNALTRKLIGRGWHFFGEFGKRLMESPSRRVLSRRRRSDSQKYRRGSPWTPWTDACDKRGWSHGILPHAPPELQRVPVERGGQPLNETRRGIEDRRLRVRSSSALSLR